MRRERSILVLTLRRSVFVRNALQNSPLSGAYTDFNFHLQSAIDAGTLGGVETQVGGQVHADAAAYLARLPAGLEGALGPHIGGGDLGIDQTRLWLTGLGEYFKSDGRAGVADSTERSAGTVAGATHRLGPQASVHFGLGYSAGSVRSAGGRVEGGTALATFGGRFGLASLDAGPYFAARAQSAGSTTTVGARWGAISGLPMATAMAASSAAGSISVTSSAGAMSC